uniref:Uncharacterized protein n=1 Tax=Anguilla anguilla TaxID=7936 RepID=A0A0E9TU80_ANGAN
MTSQNKNKKSILDYHLPTSVKRRDVNKI